MLKTKRGRNCYYYTYNVLAPSEPFRFVACIIVNTLSLLHSMLKCLNELRWIRSRANFVLISRSSNCWAGSWTNSYWILRIHFGMFLKQKLEAEIIWKLYNIVFIAFKLNQTIVISIVEMNSNEIKKEKKIQKSK